MTSGSVKDGVSESKGKNNYHTQHKLASTAHKGAHEPTGMHTHTHKKIKSPIRIDFSGHSLKYWYQSPFPLTVSWPATPKSASFAWPSVFSKIFPALISRCIFLIKWRYSSPLRVDCNIVAISSSVNWKTKNSKKSQPCNITQKKRENTKPHTQLLQPCCVLPVPWELPTVNSELRSPDSSHLPVLSTSKALPPYICSAGLPQSAQMSLIRQQRPSPRLGHSLFPSLTLSARRQPEIWCSPAHYRYTLH